jgi:hypothetical protein
MDTLDNLFLRAQEERSNLPYELRQYLRVLHHEHQQLKQDLQQHLQEESTTISHGSSSASQEDDTVPLTQADAIAVLTNSITTHGHQLVALGIRLRQVQQSKTTELVYFTRSEEEALGLSASTGEQG